MKFRQKFGIPIIIGTLIALTTNVGISLQVAQNGLIGARSHQRAGIVNALLRTILETNTQYESALLLDRNGTGEISEALQQMSELVRGTSEKTEELTALVEQFSTE